MTDEIRKIQDKGRQYLAEKSKEWQEQEYLTTHGPQENGVVWHPTSQEAQKYTDWGISLPVVVQNVFDEWKLPWWKRWFGRRKILRFASTGINRLSHKIGSSELKWERKTFKTVEQLVGYLHEAPGDVVFIAPTERLFKGYLNPMGARVFHTPVTFKLVYMEMRQYELLQEIVHSYETYLQPTSQIGHDLMKMDSQDDLQQQNEFIDQEIKGMANVMEERRKRKSS